MAVQETLDALLALYQKTAAPVSAAAVARSLGRPVDLVLPELKAARAAGRVRSDDHQHPSVWSPAPLAAPSAMC